jgi:glycosyltransferase involved in cell wall biosynthesis
VPLDSEIPRVSIGMAVYNGEAFLAQSLEALLKQTYRNFELIICDNCSTDRTQEICRTFAAADSRIHYHRNEANIGAPRNFNLAFSFARGEYFKWSGADDICAPEFIEKCVNVLERHPELALCYPKTVWIDARSQPIQPYDDFLDMPFPSPSRRLKHLLWNIRQCNANFGVVRTSIMRRTKLFQLFPDSDVPFLAEVALHGAFIEYPEPLFFRRVHDLSVRRFPSAQERMVMFDPSKKGKIVFPSWQLFFSYLAAIHRTPLSFAERLRCYFQMNVWLRRWGNKLWSDLVFAGRSLFRKPKGRST